MVCTRTLVKAHFEPCRLCFEIWTMACFCQTIVHVWKEEFDFGKYSCKRLDVCVFVGGIQWMNASFRSSSVQEKYALLSWTLVLQRNCPLQLKIPNPLHVTGTYYLALARCPQMSPKWQTQCHPDYLIHSSLNDRTRRSHIWWKRACPKRFTRTIVAAPQVPYFASCVVNDHELANFVWYRVKMASNHMLSPLWSPFYMVKCIESLVCRMVATVFGWKLLPSNVFVTRHNRRLI